ncbi:MAG: hypothetical protein K1X64_10195 [Myxococcaceae bacterium]|nr:hypothetical protein [Myxococcaceae bacterium]
MISSTPLANDRGRERSTRIRALGAVLTAALWVSPTQAFAGPRPPTQGLAQDYAQKGQQFYDKGQYGDAAVSFATAHRLDPRPALLFNIAQCHRRLENFEESAKYYARYLAEESRISAGRRKVAQQLLDEVLLAKAQQDETAARAHAEAMKVVPEEDAAAVKVQLRRPTVEPMPPVPPALNVANPEVHAEPSQASIFKTWWFWTGVTVVAASAGAIAYLSVPRAAQPTLGTADLRNAR